MPRPEVVRDGSGRNELFWEQVSKDIYDHQVHAEFHGGNLLTINDDGMGAQCFDHTLLCSVDDGGQAFLHTSDGNDVSPPARITADDLETFIDLFSVDDASPLRFLEVRRDESAMRKDGTELQFAGVAVDPPDIPPTEHDEAGIFLIYFEDVLRSRGVEPETRGNNVLVLRGGAFQHELVFSVDEHQDLRLHASDGRKVQPPEDWTKADLVHFVLHYHSKPTISPVRFRAVHNGPREVAGNTEENGPAPADDGGAHNPRHDHQAQYGNPRSARARPRARKARR